LLYTGFVQQLNMVVLRLELAIRLLCSEL